MEEVPSDHSPARTSRRCRTTAVFLPILKLGSQQPKGSQATHGEVEVVAKAAGRGLEPGIASNY